MTPEPSGAAARPLLVVEHLKKVYPTATGGVEAVRDLHFSVPEGQLVCIVGPSGAGKTTLLKCIAGLLPITSGRIELLGEAITAPPKAMAVVFQEYGRSLFPWMSVEANVELPLKSAGVSKPERRAAAADALHAVGLDDAGGKYPWQLSGGMQQRVAIARALAYKPKVLIMDEPFAAVDAQTRADLEDLIRVIWKQLGVTILFVTHDIDESVYLGERVVVLSNSPTVVQDDVVIDLPAERDQLTTRSHPQFAALRSHIYEQIQRAKHNRGTETASTPTVLRRH
ncbi:ABC transporter ATP-binding protein [Protaetiibacter mangrovi]|uniref:ABC transporter ATP-binding protein n=1 Tax=Protaetiibacter mangrovi TaxID=2970926 RepID=A0ABT1ZGJ1_9MICO|nr:ABC transporter ATP-binding protein [Protaetiibacter mangrovi]MCS0499836.1 ABC transporter ATP-binding protein [Protaetiibacter mangrovi]TPX02964.1 ABC transporter ATP-binding protein [Schumannella luteola]